MLRRWLANNLALLSSWLATNLALLSRWLAKYADAGHGLSIGRDGPSIRVRDLLSAADVWMPVLAVSGAAALTGFWLSGRAWHIAFMTGVGGSVVSFIPSAFAAFRGGGVSLTLPVRAICLMVIAGSFSAVLALATAPAERSSGPGVPAVGGTIRPDPRIDALMTALRRSGETISLYQQLNNSLLAALSQMKSEGSDPAERVLAAHADRLAQLQEQEQARLRDLEELRHRQPAAFPSPQPASPTDREPGGGPFNGEVIIPPVTREVLERTERGRTLLEQFPILGPALGALLGGTKRGEVRRVVETLVEGGRIPPRADLAELLAAASDLELARTELEALIERGQRRGVINDELATGIRREIEAVVTQLRADIPPEVSEALRKLRAAIREGRTCDPSVTAPDFPRFSTLTLKQQVIARVPEQALKDCLRQFPPTI